VAARLRISKAKSVSSSLEKPGMARLDQMKVWNEISAYQMKAGSRSVTSKLADAFRQKDKEAGRFGLGESNCKEAKGLDSFGHLAASSRRRGCSSRRCSVSSATRCRFTP